MVKIEKSTYYNRFKDNIYLIRLLREKDHNVKRSKTMGSVQAIIIKDQIIYGVADTRRPGALAKGN